MTEQDIKQAEPTTEVDEVADFDAFWQLQDRKGKQVRVMGELITLPPALPLQFELEAKRLQRSQSDKDVRKMVALLFGADTMERWASKGMDAEQFAVVLFWASANVAGAEMSMDEALAEYRKQESGKAAKGPKAPKNGKRKTSGRSS